MLHDAGFARTRTSLALDRREVARAQCPGELVLCWLHQPDLPIRFQLLDVSDGGYRLRSSLPVLQGTVAMVLRLLPEGTPLDQAALVVWSRPIDGTDDYELGLRRL